MEQVTEKKQIQNIGDIAKELGLSKTTVSRAISGKGRVSQATRKKVQEFVSQYHYYPNAVARGLAEKKTYNIALVVPKSFTVLDLPFLRKSMNAVCETAAERNYDVLLSMSEADEYMSLKRILDNRKVDGVILSRTLLEDPMLDLLIERQVPFVAMGRLKNQELYQVDNNHVEACQNLTALLLLKDYRNMALFGGELRNIVNQSRLEGFKKAYAQIGAELPSECIYLELEHEEQLEKAVEDAVKKHVSCFVCMDDALCKMVLRRLRVLGLRVPDDVKVASFFDSQLMAENNPPVTALHFDSEELGRTACRQLLDLLDGKQVEKNICLGYQLMMRDSTT